MNDFIETYEQAFSKEYCESVINHFELLKKSGFTDNRQNMEKVSKLKKDDEFAFFNLVKEISLQATGELSAQFNDTFWNYCYPTYAEKYDGLKQFAKHNSYHIKVQKTEVGGGYHVWHCESGSRECSSRILAWVLYLNDVEEGGETEFLYQHKRVKPRQGTVVIWPASFTHIHRGNPPLSNSKYIVTGWVEF